MNRNFEEQHKVRIKNNTSTKHEIIKTVIVKLIKEKYKRNSNWINIYSEWRVNDGKICDIYLENLKTNEAYAFEVQKNVSKKWAEETKRIYDKWEKYLFTTDWILVEEDKISDNIKKMEKQIKEFIP